jgi:hypothetical protein
MSIIKSFFHPNNNDFNFNISSLTHRIIYLHISTSEIFIYKVNILYSSTKIYFPIYLFKISSCLSYDTIATSRSYLSKYNRRYNKWWCYACYLIKTFCLFYKSNTWFVLWKITDEVVYALTFFLCICLFTYVMDVHWNKIEKKETFCYLSTSFTILFVSI